jgi:hypothetical protein
VPENFSTGRSRFCHTKTLNKRRSYHCEYKRRLRAQQSLTNSGQTLVREAYICLKVPHLRLPGIAFRDGWFITDNPDEQDNIEQGPFYGRDIFSWRLDP